MNWLEGLTHKDWLLDGYPIRGDRMMEMWNGLDWSGAWVDMGPSVAGNLGPYWHVPLKSEDTIHRLYPKLLKTKWLPVVRQAVDECVTRLNTDALQKENDDLRKENLDLRLRSRSEAAPARCIAERLFEADCAECELEEALSEAGVSFERLGWDEYDYSLEIYGVPAADRLSEEAQRIIHEAGFEQAYVNHTDKWETHYSFKPRQSLESLQSLYEFIPSKGWRVSYPHKRGKGEKGIWVEEFIDAWPRDWFETGEVIIKPSNVERAR